MDLTLSDRREQLDQLLELICVELQLTDAQYKKAVGSYESVYEWLIESKLVSSFEPNVYPQGSIALGTTVRPRKQEEFDVDAVLELKSVDSRVSNPMQVYRLVRDRLLEHGTYRDMLEEKERCLRLDYAGQFHLDIIPACPFPKNGVQWGQYAIAIPDKEQNEWVSTNPKGFVAWFEEQTQKAMEYRSIALSAEPLPLNQEAGSKTPLQRVVQLFKRRRDVHFNGSDYAPKSILLTTIDGELYRGEESLSKCIVNILDEIIELGEQSNHRGIPVISNPTDPEENLARHWREDRRHFQSFVEYVAVFRDGMERLLSAKGLENTASILGELFDPQRDFGVVDRAVRSYTGRFQNARNAGKIRIGKNTGTLTSVTATQEHLAIPKTRFWGHE